MEMDALLNIPQWMYDCAESIASMPFRREFFNRDVAVQIAKHLPSSHWAGIGKYKMQSPPQKRKLLDKQGWSSLVSYRKANGLCWRCGKPAVTDRRQCAYHMEKDRLRYWNGLK